MLVKEAEPEIIPSPTPAPSPAPSPSEIAEKVAGQIVNQLNIAVNFISKFISKTQLTYIKSMIQEQIRVMDELFRNSTIFNAIASNPIVLQIGRAIDGFVRSLFGW